ncbi:MAG: DNA polymerase I [Rickettsiales bacterium]|jgi:DNA polymerase I|nr:DNA polymerase I [Rickettsiales bacterium]
MQKVILIDGYGFVFRAYHSLPPLQNPQGVFVGAVFGFANMLFKVIKEHPNDKIIVVLDAGQKTFRHDIYPEYKANRPPAPEDLKPQFPIIRDAAKAFNLTTLEEEGLEADDLIASLTYKAEELNIPVTIISSDKDLMQLIRGDINMYDPMKNKVIGNEQVVEKFGIRADQVCDYLSLLGDSSDNIPGVKGVGAKTAASLLTEFGSLDNIYNSIGKISKIRIQNLLLDNKDNAYLSQELINLTKPRDLDFDLDTVGAYKLNQEALGKFLNIHGFYALKAKVSAAFNTNLDKNTIVQNNNKSAPLYELSQQNITELDKLLSQEQIGIFYLKLKASRIILILSKSQNFYYLISDSPDIGSLFSQPDILLSKIKSFISNLIGDNTIKMVTGNLKHLLHFLSHNQETNLISNINHHANIVDIDLIEYLLPIQDEQRLISKYQELAKTDNTTPKDIVASISLNYHNLANYVLLLKKNNLISIYHNIDRKTNLILFNMEARGVAIAKDKLQTLSYEFTKEINNLAQEIYKIAGQEFNIGSPKQLAEILFNKLEIESKKKTGKTKNKSTSSDVLENLQSQGFDIAGLILNWRHFSKLRSTYTDALPRAINNKTGRIHTVFNNCLTSTSRLSSSNPNLQNIPIRSKEGDKIRSCFIAAENKTLIGSDYSQIELRLLAHMADVKLLKQAFSEGRDIHRATAAEMFEIAEDQVSDEMRSHSKQINFGIIYGISAFGLAERLNIERKKAKDFIEKYFARYPEIKFYMDSVLENCRKNLYVETLIGRKLFFPNINTKNSLVKSFQERAVINAPLQGSASDIIKIAMVNIENEILAKKLSARLILQVHDELIFELDQSEQEKLLPIIKNGMEKAIKISVPLTVNAKAGMSWHQLK